MPQPFLDATGRILLQSEEEKISEKNESCISKQTWFQILALACPRGVVQTGLIYRLLQYAEQSPGKPGPTGRFRKKEGDHAPRQIDTVVPGASQHGRDASDHAPAGWFDLFSYSSLFSHFWSSTQQTRAPRCTLKSMAASIEFNPIEGVPPEMLSKLQLRTWSPAFSETLLLPPNHIPDLVERLLSALSDEIRTTSAGPLCSRPFSDAP